MKKLILECREDANYGSLGLYFVDAPRRDETNAASTGLLLAHDLIEHQNGFEPLGDVADELEALGAIWMVRGQFYDISRDGTGSAHTPEENIASDVTRMARDVAYGSYFPPRAPHTRAHDHDEAFREIIAHAREDLPGEMNGEEITPEQRETLEHYFACALHYMRRGARKVVRRFGSARAANTQLWAIADACDKYAKHPEHEGARYVLRFGNGEATCGETYDDSDY